ncbi:MAG: 30S ribosomal protein S17 [Planctomycetota bacterium]
MASETNTAERNELRTREGVVTSAKANKTIKVQITYQTKHPKYGKYINRRTVLQCHDEQGLAGEGDVVKIAECRPYSKTKHHRLLEVLDKAPDNR